MTLLSAFAAAFVLAVLFAVLSLYFARRNPEKTANALLSETFMKGAVVVFGVFIGFIAFFGQKWLDEIDRTISDANVALSNLDILQASYMSEIESIYFNNDGDFNDIYKDCLKIEPKFSDPDTCAATDEPKFCASAPQTKACADTIDEASYYFGFTAPGAINENFGDRIYQQDFLKKTLISGTLKKMFDKDFEIKDRFGVLSGEINSFAATGDVGKAIAALSPGSSKRARRALDVAARKVCCSIALIHDTSSLIKAKASEQARYFCDLRHEIDDELRKNLDVSIKFAARERLEEIENHVKTATEGPEACAYVPKPESRD